MAKKPTLCDIASRAGVAVSIVSQVLNNKPNRSPETRQRVLDAAEELGYRNRVEFSHTVKSNQSTVGLLTKSCSDDILLANPFYSYVIAGAELSRRH